MLSGSAGRMRFPPQGLLGGRDGSFGAIEVNGEAIAPSSSPNITFREGDTVCLRLPGGGGHGDPARRSRDRHRGGSPGRICNAGRSAARLRLRIGRGGAKSPLPGIAPTGGKRKWCRARVSNPRPADYKSAALPTELARRPAYSTRSPAAAKRPACSREGGGARPAGARGQAGVGTTQSHISVFFPIQFKPLAPKKEKFSHRGLQSGRNNTRIKREQKSEAVNRGRFCGAFFCFGRPASPEPGSCRACSVPGADPAHRTGAPAKAGAAATRKEIRPVTDLRPQPASEPAMRPAPRARARAIRRANRAGADARPRPRAIRAKQGRSPPSSSREGGGRGDGGGDGREAAMARETTPRTGGSRWSTNSEHDKT